MDSRVIEIRKHLKKKLDPMRFEHTLGVSYTCQALAMRYGYDLDKAEPLRVIPQEKQTWGCWIRSFMWQIILSPGVIKLRICPG